MNNMIFLVTYTMKCGLRKEFLNEVKAAGLLDAIRAEEGCVRYDYYLAEDTEEKLLVFEEWLSPEHQAVHMTQPHMDNLKAIKDKYVIDTALNKAQAL